MKELDKIQESDITSEEILEMMRDSSELLAKHNENVLGAAALAYKDSNALVNNAEFWSWMNRNYSGNSGHMFASNEAMNNYIAQGSGKEDWFSLQLQGKGYEWDWMTKERGQLKNIFNRYDAGDVANRPGTDVTKTNLFSGKSQEYQMKAYTSKTNPNLKNTPKDAVVVTNAEKIGYAGDKGYNTEQFQDATTIKSKTGERMNEVKSGKASPTYSFKNVAATMGKSGLIGCAAGICTEIVLSYRSWKDGKITDEEYLVEILKSGGDAGITSAATAGVMIPISAAITTAGLSTIITIPISFVMGGVINKIVAPCFGRGDYKKVLSEAKYYQSMDSIFRDMVYSMNMAADCYYNYVRGMIQNKTEYKKLKRENQNLDEQLNELYDLI